MSTSTTARSLVLLLLLSFTLVSSKQLCHPEDLRALLRIKKELPYQTAQWTPDVACCSWPAVFCDATIDYHVNSLYFANTNGPFHIPSAVGDLPYVNDLGFYNITNFSGSIPYSITKLKYLNSLQIRSVNLTGTITDFLGQLKNLTILDLSYNKLTGPIPSSLSQIPKLTYFILSHNQLSGEIPVSFKDIDFKHIDLSRNSLRGDASFLFGSNKTTKFMDLSFNMFAFNMSNIQLQHRFRHLDLSHNKIYGSIPEAMTQLQLNYLYLCYNRLCGPIPQGGYLQTFSYYAYFQNRCLCGAPLNVTCK